MAVLKTLRGLKENIPSTLEDGALYFCTDTGDLYFDYIDNGVLKRKAVSEDELKGKADLEHSHTYGDLVVDSKYHYCYQIDKGYYQSYVIPGSSNMKSFGSSNVGDQHIIAAETTFLYSSSSEGYGTDAEDIYNYEDKCTLILSPSIYNQSIILTSGSIIIPKTYYNEDFWGRFKTRVLNNSFSWALKVTVPLAFQLTYSLSLTFQEIGNSTTEFLFTSYSFPSAVTLSGQYPTLINVELLGTCTG